MTLILIRAETLADHLAVRRITIDAFAASEHGHNEEAEIVEGLRHECEQAVSLVAHEGEEIVGHIIFTAA